MTNIKKLLSAILCLSLVAGVCVESVFSFGLVSASSGPAQSKDYAISDYADWIDNDEIKFYSFWNNAINTTTACVELSSDSGNLYGLGANAPVLRIGNTPCGWRSPQCIVFDTTDDKYPICGLSGKMLVGNLANRAGSAIYTSKKLISSSQNANTKTTLEDYQCLNISMDTASDNTGFRLHIWPYNNFNIQTVYDSSNGNSTYTVPNSGGRSYGDDYTSSTIPNLAVDAQGNALSTAQKTALQTYLKSVASLSTSDRWIDFAVLPEKATGYRVELTLNLSGYGEYAAENDLPLKLTIVYAKLFDAGYASVYGAGAFNGNGGDNNGDKTFFGDKFTVKYDISSYVDPEAKEFMKEIDEYVTTGHGSVYKKSDITAINAILQKYDSFSDSLKASLDTNKTSSVQLVQLRKAKQKLDAGADYYDDFESGINWELTDEIPGDTFVPTNDYSEAAASEAGKTENGKTSAFWGIHGDSEDSSNNVLWLRKAFSENVVPINGALVDGKGVTICGLPTVAYKQKNLLPENSKVASVSGRLYLQDFKYGGSARKYVIGVVYKQPENGEMWRAVGIGGDGRIGSMVRRSETVGTNENTDNNSWFMKTECSVYQGYEEATKAFRLNQWIEFDLSYNFAQGAYVYTVSGLLDDGTTQISGTVTTTIDDYQCLNISMNADAAGFKLGVWPYNNFNLQTVYDSSNDSNVFTVPNSGGRSYGDNYTASDLTNLVVDENGAAITATQKTALKTYLTGLTSLTDNDRWIDFKIVPKQAVGYKAVLTLNLPGYAEYASANGLPDKLTVEYARNFDAGYSAMYGVGAFNGNNGDANGDKTFFGDKITAYYDTSSYVDPVAQEALNTIDQYVTSGHGSYYKQSDLSTLNATLDYYNNLDAQTKQFVDNNAKARLQIAQLTVAKQKLEAGVDCFDDFENGLNWKIEEPVDGDTFIPTNEFSDEALSDTGKTVDGTTYAFWGTHNTIESTTNKALYLRKAFSENVKPINGVTVNGVSVTVCGLPSVAYGTNNMLNATDRIESVSGKMYLKDFSYGGAAKKYTIGIAYKHGTTGEHWRTVGLGGDGKIGAMTRTDTAGTNVDSGWFTSHQCIAASGYEAAINAFGTNQWLDFSMDYDYANGYYVYTISGLDSLGAMQVSKYNLPEATNMLDDVLLVNGGVTSQCFDDISIKLVKMNGPESKGATINKIINKVGNQNIRFEVDMAQAISAAQKLGYSITSYGACVKAGDLSREVITAETPTVLREVTSLQPAPSKYYVTITNSAANSGKRVTMIPFIKYFDGTQEQTLFADNTDGSLANNGVMCKSVMGILKKIYLQKILVDSECDSSLQIAINNYNIAHSSDAGYLNLDMASAKAKISDFCNLAISTTESKEFLREMFVKFNEAPLQQ